MDSTRGVLEIVVCCCNSSCNNSCDAMARNGRRTIAFFLLFEVQVVRVKRRSKHVSSAVAAASIQGSYPAEVRK